MMSERELQGRVRDMCRALGLAVDHAEDSRMHWLKGMPDLVVIGSGVLWRELKRQGEDPTREQARVGRLLSRAGQDWAVWRPSDYLDGTIAAQLAAISLPRARA